MRVPIVFVDANVLYSKTLRDWLFLLREQTQGDMFTVASSNDVIAEVLRSIRRRNPTGPGHLTGSVKELLERQLDEIVRDFPDGIAFPGDDEHDTHVHASAITCGATYLITDDNGFQRVADVLPCEVHSADSFFHLIAENVPQVVDDVIRIQSGYNRSRGRTTPLSDSLATAGCSTFAEIVDQHLRAISSGRTTSGIAANIESRPSEAVAPLEPVADVLEAER